VRHCTFQGGLKEGEVARGKLGRGVRDLRGSDQMAYEGNGLKGLGCDGGEESERWIERRRGKESPVLVGGKRLCAGEKKTG